jgi:hypothetical protein
VTYWSIVVAAIAIVKSYKVCVKEGVTKPTATFSFFSYFYFQWISGRSDVPSVVVVVVLRQRDTAWGHNTHSSSTTVYDVSAILRFLLRQNTEKKIEGKKGQQLCVCTRGQSRGELAHQDSRNVYSIDRRDTRTSRWENRRSLSTRKVSRGEEIT